MRKFLKVGILLSAFVSLSACAQTYKAKKVQLEDGDTFEVATIEQGAQSQSLWRLTDADSGQQKTNVTTSDSMPARVIPAVANTATGGLISAGTQLALDNRATDRCKKHGCPGGGPSTLVQVGSPIANALAESASQSDAAVLPTGCTTCPTGLPGS